MPIDFSVLNNGLGRKITGVGQVFSTTGHYVKCSYLIPSNGILSANLKALIYQEQVGVFSEIERLDGITFDKEGLEYFNEDSIHESVNFDVNKLAIWIDLKDQQSTGTDKNRTIINATIYVTPGKGSPELQVKRSSAYLRAIINLLSVVPSQFFVVGWPVTIPASYSRSNLQPEVQLQFTYESNPDVESIQGNASRPIGRLDFQIQLTPKINILP
jgi:hypothetical protein